MPARRPGGRHRRAAGGEGEGRGTGEPLPRARPVAGAARRRPAEALMALLPWLRDRLGGRPLAAHRASRGAWRADARATGARDAGAAGGAQRLSSRSRRCTSRTTSRRSAPRWSAARACRRSPASTPPSTAPCRRSRRPSPSRPPWPEQRHPPLRLPRPVLRVHRLRPAASWRRRSPRGAWSSRISATAPRSARCGPGAASRPRWASRRSTACRWARAAASSTRRWCCTC